MKISGIVYMNINFSWNFHQKVFTLTISFNGLNASIEFVLIYRPHPVYETFLEPTIMTEITMAGKAQLSMLKALWSSPPELDCSLFLSEFKKHKKI